MKQNIIINRIYRIKIKLTNIFIILPEEVVPVPFLDPRALNCGRDKGC